MVSKIKAPARNNPEIPILCGLSKVHESGMEAKSVLKELKKKYYASLSTADREGVYADSKKTIFDTLPMIRI